MFFLLSLVVVNPSASRLLPKLFSFHEIFMPRSGNANEMKARKKFRMLTAARGGIQQRKTRAMRELRESRRVSWACGLRKRFSRLERGSSKSRSENEDFDSELRSQRGVESSASTSSRLSPWKLNFMSFLFALPSLRVVKPLL